jgi:hypothetical protein
MAGAWPVEGIALIGTDGNEPASPNPRDRIYLRRPALAVAQENAFVPSSRRHHHRPPGIQVYVPDHDVADRKRSTFAPGVADAALVGLFSQWS